MGTNTNVRSRPREKTAQGSDVRVVLDAFRHIVRVLRLSSRAAEKRVGVSAAQLFVLHKLAEGRALSLGELADRTFTHQSSVSVVVGRLVARGLVARRSSAADGRRVELALTGSGRTLLRRAPAAAQERLIEAIEGLGTADRRALATTLARLVQRLRVDGKVPGMFFEEKGAGYERA
jgi:DNA-binding MarR family transcriptional regulator